MSDAMDVAVEAAAKALYEWPDPSDKWEDAGAGEKRRWRTNARPAVEAAAPILRASIEDELRSADREGRSNGTWEGMSDEERILWLEVACEHNPALASLLQTATRAAERSERS